MPIFKYKVQLDSRVDILSFINDILKFGKVEMNEEGVNFFESFRPQDIDNLEKIEKILNYCKNLFLVTRPHIEELLYKLENAKFLMAYGTGRGTILKNLKILYNIEDIQRKIVIKLEETEEELFSF